MAGMEYGDRAERQPLVQRRLSTREDERWRFEQAQRQVVGDVALSSDGSFAQFLKLIVLLFFLGAVTLSLYIYFRTLWIIMFHLDRPCDQPLGPWLVGWIVFPTLQRLIDPPPSFRAEHHESGYRHLRKVVFHCSWFLIGFTWMTHCKTCQQTNPELYDWVHFVVHVYVVVVVYIVLAPILIALALLLALRLFQTLIDYGWISNPKAASLDTVENLEVVPYDASVFSDDPEDARPSGECCCCTEAFGPDKPIVRTSCGHYYHKVCLGEWLRLARTCPLCRCDLDAAAAGKLPSLDLHGEDRFGYLNAQGDEELARRLQEDEFQIAGGFP